MEKPPFSESQIDINGLSTDIFASFTLSNSDGASPLDYETMISSGTDMRVVATDADSGEAVYIKKSEIRKDDYGAFSASSALPPYNKAYHWHGRNYFDGGISDPIPHHLAFSEGCEKVVIILTLPKTHFRDTSKDAEAAEKMKKYPAMVPLMQHKSELYNRQLKETLELEEKGKVLIVAPDGYFKGGSLAKDKNQIMQMYEEALKDDYLPSLLWIENGVMEFFGRSMLEEIHKQYDSIDEFLAAEYGLDAQKLQKMRDMYTE